MGESDGQVIERLTRHNMLLQGEVEGLKTLVSAQAERAEEAAKEIEQLKEKVRELRETVEFTGQRVTAYRRRFGPINEEA